MNHPSKILWGEGLFLRPQHFQRQDLYHESRLIEFGRAVHPYLWGIRSLKFDMDALASGVLRITEVCAILPDGESVNAPSCDDLPEPVDLTSVDSYGAGVVFYLALPYLRDTGPNFSACPDDAGKTHRYRQHDVPAPDLYTNAIDSTLSVLKKSVRLLSDLDNRERYVSLPLARVRTTSSGGYELDNAFVPPVVSIQASAPIYQMVRRLIEMLQAKAHALYGYHREPSLNIVEFRSGDVASFWLLHTVNTACAALQHLFRHPDLHPERLFQELLRLAGQLLTFSKAYSLSDLPAYHHAAPGLEFMKLDQLIRELLETVISSRYFSVMLAEPKPAFHLGRLDSDKVASGAAYYLGATADMPPAELVEAVPQRFKVGAPDDVDKMVSSAMPGVRLMAAPQVPAPIPVRPGCYYFSIEPHGPLYERMIQSGSIMIYTTAGFRNLKLELFAVTQ
ncbi:type VI secretion system baseplate subunit TssK [Noviherbaspirillum sp. UKPF54]|uniref:type VI secretion system baseplate subunit TssK n=1 Tax=Noviherbaspirillum sp. UKPF54 TaxID=2601898 RepID=UPI0011B11CF6|nr:type VI secretion system baseplate subunit TssK [Noviherbaspirillum sp. UKPF54]QDZ27660.1 type VI secretion system baseplate subunit TssK [Noviherbaspirillum sp. UKPF54]